MHRIEDYEIALGQLTIAFAALEETLVNGFAELSDCDYKIAAIVCGAVSFRQKIQILNAILRLRPELGNGLSRFQEHFTEAKDCEALRNKFVHSHWNSYVHPTDDGPTVKIKREKIGYKPTPRFVREVTPVEKIIEAKQLCSSCAFALEELFELAGDVVRGVKQYGRTVKDYPLDYWGASR